MFADDLVLFADANKEQAQCIQASLAQFYRASGQKINVQKSRIYFSPKSQYK